MQQLRQLLYTSVSTAEPGRTDVAGILECARRNNALDSVTGLLYTDGNRFLQAIEGGEDPVGGLLDRLRADTRHKDIQLLSDRPIARREFGSWDMADRRAGPYDGLDDRLKTLLGGASLAVRGIFESLVAARRRAA